MRTLAEIHQRLQTGESSRSLVEGCLARIADPAGEGSRAFIQVVADTALAAGDQHDR